MRRRRYGGYHGQSGARKMLNGILWLLAVVLVLVVTGLVIGQRYLVYTDNGVRLELPFFQREQTSSAPSVSVDIVQLPGKPKPEQDPKEEEPEQLEPEAVKEEKTLS